jgi:hypothetical protein
MYRAPHDRGISIFSRFTLAIFMTHRFFFNAFIVQIERSCRILASFRSELETLEEAIEGVYADWLDWPAIEED